MNDGPSSAAAVALATDLAREGASLLLCRIVERERVAAAVGNVPDAARVATEAMAASEQGLEHLRSTVAASVPGVDAVTRDGPSVWRALVSEAERWRADLVIVGAGSRRHGSVGSTAQRVVRHSPCTVLVVGGEARGLAKLVCAVDFSPPSRRAMEVAAELAARRGAELRFVHAISRDRSVSSSAVRSAAERLRGCVADVVPNDRGTAEMVVVEGRPAEAIAKTARGDDYDLVIVGSHGRTGIEHFILGSVAEEIVRCADRPVLIVRGESPAPESARTATAAREIRLLTASTRPH